MIVDGIQQVSTAGLAADALELEMRTSHVSPIGKMHRRGKTSTPPVRTKAVQLCPLALCSVLA